MASLLSCWMPSVDAAGLGAVALRSQSGRGVSGPLPGTTADARSDVLPMLGERDSGRPGLDRIQVADRIAVVVPLLVHDDPQALPERELRSPREHRGGP